MLHRGDRAQSVKTLVVDIVQGQSDDPPFRQPGLPARIGLGWINLFADNAASILNV